MGDRTIHATHASQLRIWNFQCRYLVTEIELQCNVMRRSHVVRTHHMCTTEQCGNVHCKHLLTIIRVKGKHRQSNCPKGIKSIGSFLPLSPTGFAPSDAGILELARL